MINFENISFIDFITILVMNASKLANSVWVNNNIDWAMIIICIYQRVNIAASYKASINEIPVINTFRMI